MLWSEDGAQLFSGGSDGRLACWDVLQGSRETAWDLGRGAIRTLAHRSSQPAALLATFASGPAAVVELGSGACRALPFPGWQPAAIEGPALGSAPGPAPSPEADAAKPEPGASPGAARPAAELEAGPRSPATPADPEVPVKAQGPDPSQPSPGDSKRADPAVPSLGQAACCSPDGDVLFASARGALLVVRAADLAVVDAIRVCDGAGVVHFFCVFWVLRAGKREREGGEGDQRGIGARPSSPPGRLATRARRPCATFLPPPTHPSTDAAQHQGLQPVAGCRRHTAAGPGLGPGCSGVCTPDQATDPGRPAGTAGRAAQGAAGSQGAWEGLHGHVGIKIAGGGWGRPPACTPVPIPIPAWQGPHAQ